MPVVLHDREPGQGKSLRDDCLSLYICHSDNASKPTVYFDRSSSLKTLANFCLKSRSGLHLLGCRSTEVAEFLKLRNQNDGDSEEEEGDNDDAEEDAEDEDEDEDTAKTRKITPNVTTTNEDLFIEVGGV